MDFKSDDPEIIARSYVAAGYAAAVCPAVSLDQPERIKAIREAFTRHDLCLAEVGVWNNLLDPDPAKRAANLRVNIDKMALAEEIGARCCVNIAGSFNPLCWDGPHPHNLSEEAFELTVENVHKIIAAVRPKRSYFTLETMPGVPDSPDSHLRTVGPWTIQVWRAPGPRQYAVNCPER
jgi:sugar phosphate isomerase/epimerase